MKLLTLKPPHLIPTPARCFLFALASFGFIFIQCEIVLASGDDSGAFAKTTPVIVPTPQKIRALNGAQPFQLLPSSQIVVTRDALKANRGNGLTLTTLAHVLSAEIELLTGKRLAIVSGTGNEAGPHDVQLSISETSAQSPLIPEVEQAQKYSFTASSNGLIIQGSDYKGVCFGTASLLQALDVNAMTVPACQIDDHANAAYRAVMIDVARKVHSIGVIKDVVRLCRLYKVRYLHLHLTDDQNFTFPFGPVTDKAPGNFCYSLNELRELVRYADERGVTIIPEFDLPGHSTLLKRSGYLSPSKSDADVAHPNNYAKIATVIDRMLDVFSSSPYFHIGGDESGAGQNLIPFLESVNRHVRKRNRRLLVWEGFHGSPTKQLPAEGDDRIIVMSWESSYNAPWDLLNNGYQIINASWKPMYLVSGYGGLIHAGAGGGCKCFALEDIYRWDKNTFMHWEPGRAVFEDRGPKDPNLHDHQWSATWIDKQDQILGGQLLYWEQREGSVIHFLRDRVPLLAERLWNPSANWSFDEMQSRINGTTERTFAIVQPVQMIPSMDRNLPAANLYQPYEGEATQIKLVNRTKLKGSLRFSKGKFSGSLGAPNFGEVPLPDLDYTGPITAGGAFSLRAELVRPNGDAIDGHTWGYYNNWPMRVQITEYDTGGKTLDKVPDLLNLPSNQVLRTYQMPYIRGLLRNIRQVGQLTVADFVAPQDGQFNFELRTQSGHATFYLDLNQDLEWSEDEALIRDTPNTEKGQFGSATLLKGQRYRLRIDHSTGMPRPVLNLFVIVPGQPKPQSINPFLQLPSSVAQQP